MPAHDTIHSVEKMQAFYRENKALVTSPFITREGMVDKALLETVFSKLGITMNGSPFLDLGCGTGLLSTYVSQRSDRYIGVDINPHENFKRLQNEKSQFLQGSALSLPFKDHSVAMISCVDSFEHYPDPFAAAGEIYRVLRHDGQLFLSVPNYANVAGWVKRRMEGSGRYQPNTWAPFDFWKPQELEHFITPGLVRSVFSTAGFTQFRMAGFAREIVIGLLPWLWHPKCPGKVNGILSRLFRLFEKPLATLFPQVSLHTFWQIAP